MSLQIDLFKDDNIKKTTEFRFRSVASREFTFPKEFDVKEFLKECNENLNPNDEKLERIIKAVNRERVVKDYWGAVLDSHVDLFCCNAIKRYDSKVVVYSVRDLLPMFLSILSKSDVKPIMELDRIEEFSRDLLEMEFNSTVSLKDFIGLSSELDEYIQSLFLQQNNPKDLLKLFINNLNEVMSRILKYIAIHIETYTSLVFLSLDKSKIIFKSNLGDAEVLQINSPRFSYELFPLILDNCKEYFEQIDDFKFGGMLCF